MLSLRVRFAKTGPIRFVSHRDVARLFERAVRRVGLPVRMSQGFSPRMRLSFGLALPTCYESDGEYADLSLRDGAVTDDGAVICADAGSGAAGARFEPCDTPPALSPALSADAACDAPDATPGPWSHCALAAALTRALPPGMTVTAAVLLQPSGPSLQQAVACCRWRFAVSGLSPDDAPGAVAELLCAAELPTLRSVKGRRVPTDLRPGIVSLAVVGPAADGVRLIADLACSPRVVRPAEVAAVLAPDGEMTIARRVAQYLRLPDADCSSRLDEFEPLRPHACACSGAAVPCRAADAA